MWDKSLLVTLSHILYFIPVLTTKVSNLSWINNLPKPIFIKGIII